MENYNYSENGFYFVTFCTKNHEYFFGEIFDGELILNEFGRLLEKQILISSKIRKEIEINYFVIMPNHVHMIVEIKYSEIAVVNAGLHSLQDSTKNPLSNCIQRIKSSFTKEIREKFSRFDFAWQKSFYDEIIRNEKHLENIVNYIKGNPQNWENDKYNKLL